MKAMILAAGRGERLRPLTDKTPKPLIPVAGRPLIAYTIASLKKAGFFDIVINLAHLGDQIKQTLGDGSHFGVSIEYSDEGETRLETGGGIYHALPLLGREPFLVVNGDVATNFAFTQVPTSIDRLAHLILVPNPDHNPHGDFALDGKIARPEGEYCYTYAGIGIYHPDLFLRCAPGRFRLAPLLRQAMTDRKVTGDLYEGFWTDVGSLERLQMLEEEINAGIFLAS